MLIAESITTLLKKVQVEYSLRMRIAGIIKKTIELLL